MIKIKKTPGQQTNKHTNKQINIFLKSYISQPNQVKSSQNFQGIFLWEFQDDLNKKQTGQQTNKQTNKQINSFFRSLISQPNQVRSSQNFQGIFLWVS